MTTATTAIDWPISPDQVTGGEIGHLNTLVERSRNTTADVHNQVHRHRRRRDSYEQTIATAAITIRNASDPEALAIAREVAAAEAGLRLAEVELKRLSAELGVALEIETGVKGRRDGAWGTLLARRRELAGDELASPLFGTNQNYERTRPRVLADIRELIGDVAGLAS